MKINNGFLMKHTISVLFHNTTMLVALLLNNTIKAFGVSALHQLIEGKGYTVR